jgi:hypothetical protein
MACKTTFISVLCGLEPIRLPVPALPVPIKQLTDAGIRRFLLGKYREPIGAIGLIREELADDFDFLLNGVIDHLAFSRGGVSDRIRLGSPGCETNYNSWSALTLCC